MQAWKSGWREARSGRIREMLSWTGRQSLQNDDRYARLGNPAWSSIPLRAGWSSEALKEAGALGLSGRTGEHFTRGNLKVELVRL